MKRAALVSLLFSVLLFAGCNTEQVENYKRSLGLLNEEAKTLQAQIDERVAEVEGIVTAANAEIAKAREQAEALPPGPDRDEVLEFIGKVEHERDRALSDAREFVDEGEEALAEIIAASNSSREKLAEVDTPVGAAGATAQQLGQYLPPPWREVTIGIGGLLLTLDQRRRKRLEQERADAKDRALQSTVEAFEIAKREGQGKINFDEPQVRDRIRAAMSSEARKAVDAARKIMSDKAPALN